MALLRVEGVRLGLETSCDDASVAGCEAATGVSWSMVMGSFQGRGWSSMPLLLVTVVPGLLATALGWRALDVLALGDEQAAQSGLDVGRARLWLLAGASCMAGAEQKKL